jgi:DNA-binding protein Alba
MTEKENTIFIGTKSFMNYVTGIVMQFTAKNQNSVTIKARGKNIKTAVDIAEAVRKRFLKDRNLNVKEVKINSEEMENKQGRKVSVSEIEIILSVN